MDFRTDKLLHGGDYNPEQWLKRKDSSVDWREYCLINRELCVWSGLLR